MNNDNISIIGKDVVIVGTVTSEGGVQLDGKLEGSLTCGGDAVLGATSEMKGDVKARSVSIAGRIEGNITADDKIEMRATAVVNGDIKARRLSVEDGVTVVGRSEVRPNGAAAAV